MSDKNRRCWLAVDRFGAIIHASAHENVAKSWAFRDGDRVIEMAPLAELERVRAQRDQFVRAWYSEADGDSDADKERWLGAEGLRLVNGKVEEIET